MRDVVREKPALLRKQEKVGLQKQIMRKPKQAQFFKEFP